MKKFFAISALVLVGCGSDGATIAEEQGDALSSDDTSMTSDSSVENETSSETSSETSGEDALVEEVSGDAVVTTDATGDSVTPGDTASETGATPTIQCGDATCDAATKVCCVTTSSRTCVDKAGSCTGSKFSCSSSSSCSSGQFCCQNTAGFGAECKAACGITEPRLCDKNSECPMGQTCKLPMFGGSIYKRCQ